MVIIECVLLTVAIDFYLFWGFSDQQRLRALTSEQVPEKRTDGGEEELGGCILLLSTSSTTRKGGFFTPPNWSCQSVEADAPYFSVDLTFTSACNCDVYLCRHISRDFTKFHRGDLLIIIIQKVTDNYCTKTPV